MGALLPQARSALKKDGRREEHPYSKGSEGVSGFVFQGRCAPRLTWGSGLLDVLNCGPDRGASAYRPSSQMSCAPICLAVGQALVEERHATCGCRRWLLLARLLTLGLPDGSATGGCLAPRGDCMQAPSRRLSATKSPPDVRLCGSLALYFFDGGGDDSGETSPSGGRPLATKSSRILLANQTQKPVWIG